MTVAALRGATLAHGEVVAVRDVDILVEAGGLVALVGGDGAGKSTVLQALSGRLAPIAGTVELPDLDDIGVVPAVGATWADLTVDENLGFVARAHGADPSTVDELLDRMGLLAARDRLAGRLSGGMRQKLALAMAVHHRPRLLVLDEPTTGVDPVSRAEIWRLLGEEITRDTAVVMATTYLDEAERATTAVLLDDGRVLAAGTPAEVVASTPGVVVSSPRRLGPTSWRRGTTWHTWLDDDQAVARDGAEGVRVVAPDMEDAAIVRALVGGAGERQP